MQMSDPALTRQRITANDLKSIAGLPILLEVESSGLSAVRWAEEYQEDIRRLIESQGALLVRGLKVLGSTEFGKTISTLFGSEFLNTSIARRRGRRCVAMSTQPLNTRPRK
jgi:hypothetical protein